jgi:predicted nicotinamide N-methyase
MLAPVRGAAAALADLEREIRMPGAGLDRLHLVPTPFVPEVRLHLAEDAILWWARMEAHAGRRLPPPFWASVWAGGQALARHLLDHPELVAGRRVLDLAAGSGLVAMAAALAGAEQVVANDIDPYAVAAVTVNARANDVRVTARGGDLLDSEPVGVDLVVAGDVLYSRVMAERMLPFLHRAAAAGADVLVGDPGRGHLPSDGLAVVADYPVPTTEPAVDTPLRRVQVLRPEPVLLRDHP